MSWQDLEHKQATTDAAQQELDRLHAAVFGSGPGRDLLDHYHGLVVDSVTTPNVTDGMVRFNEGRRHLILEIERRTDRGMKAAETG